MVWIISFVGIAITFIFVNLGTGGALMLISIVSIGFFRRLMVKES